MSNNTQYINMKNFLSIFLIAFIAPLSIFSQDDCSPEMVMDLVNQTLFEGDAPLPEGAEKFLC